ncbi:efflux RND transporter periplasmic adaptor subunit [Aureimonas fodinaquatilis]|uniref:Efflux RND transporter periplasmic adaptor subunit n=1 Tax=Aureimonas fodinaquatilis TaxID=2565783 RepID=A0A5B0DTP5_9HYPH|nr:efflux RND transporter periplasmic adaptor subunit [Aureimonas fodinaquatilis]KAA0969352.1 efflux RND transporter periplasmic adaptor subunit [Aureimonas fodinaquatilis]
MKPLPDPAMFHSLTVTRLAVVLIAAVFVLQGCKPRQSSEEPPITPVIVRSVAMETYQPATVLTGEVQARVQTELAFRVAGRVIERLADIGDRVENGQVLARLDAREQHADLAAARAGVEASQAQLDQSNSEYSRQQTLFEQGLTTRTIFEQAQEAVRTARASLDAAEAQQATAEEGLAYTELKATAPGVLTARSIEVGQVVQAAEAAFSLAENGPRDAVFQVFESLLFEKPENETIELSLVSAPEVVAAGRIREISPAVDTQSGTVRVKVAIDQTPARMTLGSAVIGRAPRAAQEALILPWSSLASDAGYSAVWVVDPQTERTALRRVDILAYETGRIILSNGLTPGELVVIDGGKFLRPDEKVEPREDVI